MFDLGWSEMAMVALVALLVLGPKQLPEAMRTFAAFTKKMRRYAQDFRSGVDGIIREAELEDAKKALDTVRRANPSTAIQKFIDPAGEVTDEVKSVEAAAKAKDDPATGGGAKVTKKALPKAEAAEGSGETAAPVPESADKGEEKRSNVVHQPFQMAPPHSIRPPGTPKKATVPPVADAKSGDGEATKKGDGETA